MWWPNHNSQFPSFLFHPILGKDRLEDQSIAHQLMTIRRARDTPPRKSKNRLFHSFHVLILSFSYIVNFGEKVKGKGRKLQQHFTSQLQFLCYCCFVILTLRQWQYFIRRVSFQKKYEVVAISNQREHHQRKLLIVIDDSETKHILFVKGITNIDTCFFFSLILIDTMFIGISLQHF